MGFVQGSGLVRVADGGGLAYSTDGGVSWTTVSGGGSNAWATARQTVLNAQVSGLTWQYIKPSTNQPGIDGATPTILATDPGIIGGAACPGAARYLTITGYVYTDLSTQRHAWCFRGKFVAPSANFQNFGPADSAGTQRVCLVSSNTLDATKLVLQLFVSGGAHTEVVTSHVIDGNTHNYAVTFDGTTYKALVDDVVVGSTAVLTNVGSGNRALIAFNTTANTLPVIDVTYGYVLT
jgi:hypothetical protein